MPRMVCGKREVMVSACDSEGEISVSRGPSTFYPIPPPCIFFVDRETRGGTQCTRRPHDTRPPKLALYSATVESTRHSGGGGVGSRARHSTLHQTHPLHIFTPPLSHLEVDNGQVGELARCFVGCVAPPWALHLCQRAPRGGGAEHQPLFPRAPHAHLRQLACQVLPAVPHQRPLCKRGGGGEGGGAEAFLSFISATRPRKTRASSGAATLAKHNASRFASAKITRAMRTPARYPPTVGMSPRRSPHPRFVGRLAGKRKTNHPRSKSKIQLLQKDHISRYVQMLCSACAHLRPRRRVVPWRGIHGFLVPSLAARISYRALLSVCRRRLYPPKKASERSVPSKRPPPQSAKVNGSLFLPHTRVNRKLFFLELSFVVRHLAGAEVTSPPLLSNTHTAPALACQSDRDRRFWKEATSSSSSRAHTAVQGAVLGKGGEAL
jgi:hypothetical protein